jgi:two-component system chemotaxis sensor kinase CheA
MDDVVNEFLIESHEGLDQLDRDLVALEHTPSDGELLARIFRCVHTVKGTCGFLGYGTLESLAHVSEGLLVQLREGTLVVTPVITSALLALVDAIRQMLASIEASGHEGDVDYSELIATLTALKEGATLPDVAPTPTPTPTSTPTPTPVSTVITTPTPTPTPVPEAVVVAPLAVGEPPETQTDGRPALSDTTIRVDVGLLDKLMNLVGELVLARNQILQYVAVVEGTPLTAAAQRLNLLTTELQEGVMKTRMQPIGNVWSKFPRVVRDLAVACNKEIRLEMDGKETELDKTLIEAIKDPLTHIVRNAADHGIETPEIRVARGKPAEGRLSLRAYHEGGQVIIEISDDGAGIDAERIKHKAVEKGLISAEHAARLSERDALALIFLPGLSTAKQVTNVSGRGVGMDVVKSNIERIGGAVDIQSELGEGSTIKIKIPLTLAIIPALIVTCAGSRYAIPQVSLVELVRREQRDGGHAIEMIHGAPVYRLRGNLLPVVYARTALESPVGAGLRDDAVNIVVLQADDRTFGLVVDEINDTEEIVVKPLGKQLKGVTAFAGATIMGDGRVALILDVMGLAHRANVISEMRDRGRVEQAPQARAAVASRQTLLVCGLGGTRRAAIPLSSVARLEEFPADSVERAGEYEAVQYRDQILPLLDLPGLLGVSGDGQRDGMLQVVVYSENNRNVGFLVRQILDIVEDEIHLDSATTRDGVLGSIVLQRLVTDVLDMSAIVRRAAPWLLTAAPMENAA